MDLKGADVGSQDLVRSPFRGGSGDWISSPCPVKTIICPGRIRCFICLIGRLLSAALTRSLVLAAAAGFIAALPAAPSCRAPDTRPCHPKTHLYHAWKIVHFGPILAVRILGRICSEKVVNPGICYGALQLMALRFALCSLCL